MAGLSVWHLVWLEHLWSKVNTSGVVLDINGIAISYSDNYQWYPSLTFDGTNYFVVWGDRRGGLPEKIYGGRINQSGTVLDPDGIPISTVATNGQYFPSVAFDNTNYLVVWDDFRSTTHNIMGARVTTAGTVLDPNGRYISNAARDQLYPAIVFGNTNYFVVWDDYRSNIDFDVYGARVDQSASVLDPNGILVTPTINYQLNPAVAFDGTNYVIIWEDNRNGSWDIYGAAVDLNGTVVSNFVVCSHTNNEIDPALTIGTGGQILTVYSRFTDYINNKLVKTMRIWGTLYSLVGTEENSGVERTGPLLLQNLPNPFENTTMIKYIIRDPDSKVVLMVYDSQGRKVKTLVNDSKTAGEYFVKWDGKDEYKNLLPEGLYFCTLKNGNHYGVKKMILLR
uniref:T9SS type A sorting domain-containing protein n=1 Tax=candidate division WOR-3 bacterium TaxID=2052148 RepID=A0A7V0Z7A3_UNCW3